MDLLYRGYKFSDEFLTDYIERIAYKNGFSSVKKFKKILAKYYFKQTEEETHNLRYQAVGRVALEMILRRNIPTDEYHRFYNIKTGRWKSECQICVSCWELTQYKRFYWWLKAYDQCHIHNEALVPMNSQSLNEKGSAEVEKFHFVVMIVNKYSESEYCQSLVLDELDRAGLDKAVIEAISNYFQFNLKVSFAVEMLDSMWCSGKFLGKCADERIQLMVEVLTKCIGAHDFWLRIIALIVLSNKRGLNSNFPTSSRSSEYVRFCQYSLGADRLVWDLQARIETLKKYDQMSEVCVKSFLCDELNMPNSLILRLKASLFALRALDFYKLEKLSSANNICELFSDVVDAKNVNRES